MNLWPDNWFSEVLKHLEPHDFTLVGSISQMGRIRERRNLVLYNWDMYSWQDYANGDWAKFGELSREAVDLWFPSVCTRHQSERIYRTRKGTVIKMFVPLDWLPEPTMGKYVLLPMRFYEKDRCFDWAKKACEELGVRLVHPNHDLTLKEYKTLLAGSGLIISPYAEASTGGMGLIEGSYLGKRCVVNGSELNGGREYLGDKGFFFTTYEEMKKLIKEHLGKPAEDCREWLREEYGVERVARQMNERLCYLKSTSPLQGR